MINNIGFPAITENRINTVSANSPLQRCELITGGICNLKCVYCKGLPLDYNEEMSNDNAKQIIAGWGKHKLQHANFSGGEPLCNKNLKFYIKCLTDNHIPYIGISTNGTFPIDQYDELVDMGVTHFAISIDGNSTTADKLAGVPGSWEKAVKSIKHLSTKTYVTASTVFTRDNYMQATDIINFIHNLGVSDIRFSSATQFNKIIPYLEVIPTNILNSHPILKYRVNNLINNKNMRGDNYNHKCFLPLDDIVVANKYHFPCSMQLREGGKPIGSIIKDNHVKPIEDIRQERLSWIDKFDCQNNEVCKKYCMDFIIEYNKRVSARINNK